jgi:protein phosphatase
VGDPKMVKPVQVVVSRASHKGIQNDRFTRNGDSFFIGKSPYFILADGMGGRKSPKIASETATVLARREILRLRRTVIKGITPEQNILPSIENIFDYVNSCMQALSDNVKNLHRFGTTLDINSIMDGTAYIGHVGDARMYHFSKENGSLDQITRDHSEVISPGDKYSQLYRPQAALTRCIPMEGVKPDVAKINLSIGDMLLMGCDGLTNYVSDEEIRKILLQGIVGSAPKLVKLANYPQDVARLLAEKEGIGFEEAQKKLGGKDNISVIVIQYGGK